MKQSRENFDVGPGHENREKPKKTVGLKWGAGGHEFEWVLNLEGYGANNYIPEMPNRPDDICNKLETILGEGFHADNRGSRIEIFTPDHTPHYQEVVSAVDKVFEDEWEGEEWDIEVQGQEQVEARYRSVEEATRKGLEEAREKMQKKMQQIRKEKGEDNN